MSIFSSRTGIEALFHRSQPSAWEDFTRQPCIFVAHKLFSWRAIRPRSSTFPTSSSPITVVCISDTHNTQPRLPQGEILIHAGDMTQSGTFDELVAAVDWLSSQPHPIKIVVAGNHDVLLDAKQDAPGNRSRSTAGPSRSPEALRASLAWKGIIYLENQHVDVTCSNGRRLRIYGSPLSPRHGNWAFQYPRADDVWHGAIPDGTDVLVTHGPPRSHCDLLHLGCNHLLRELWRVRPRLHVFGHIHAGAGMQTVEFDGLQAAYERTVIAKGGLRNLMSTLSHFLRTLVSDVIHRRAQRPRTCALVNAAMVSGLRDDQTRQAITVVI
ncbi:metallophosphoesterase domain-containing protein [Verticillium alfalfae VaMs.102]|uniref:Metallophosphoesterase domain-containing protein n=1 Tax=Verticillium alfalfae (strain VaMs.102 / ATCC MYA-4576 / FGSC 10136) TaxID=526221 RepID=C9SIJ8_VERA1|nr:metallophosphoesterase domain-containing protein [Verticillium alfalfae VaMs.102]EEY18771.1 metallophosphoesterase domain-containing protein [Verticillium alfalfae VaMs.102]